MTEGELQKRIRTLTSFATPFTLSDEEQIKINEIVRRIARISDKENHKIIDEMKKDFPDKRELLEAMKIRMLELPVNKHNQDHILKTLYDTKEAYIKWFGDYIEPKKKNEYYDDDSTLLKMTLNKKVK